MPLIFSPSLSNRPSLVPPLARIVALTASGTCSHFCLWPAKQFEEELSAPVRALNADANNTTLEMIARFFIILTMLPLLCENQCIPTQHDDNAMKGGLQFRNEQSTGSEFSLCPQPQLSTGRIDVVSFFAAQRGCHFLGLERLEKGLLLLLLRALPRQALDLIVRD